jgi:hypothetical protein
MGNALGNKVGRGGREEGNCVGSKVGNGGIASPPSGKGPASGLGGLTDGTEGTEVAAGDTAGEEKGETASEGTAPAPCASPCV